MDFYESLLNEDGLSKALKIEKKKGRLQASRLLRELKPIQDEWLQGRLMVGFDRLNVKVNAR